MLLAGQVKNSTTALYYPTVHCTEALSSAIWLGNNNYLVYEIRSVILWVEEGEKQASSALLNIHTQIQYVCVCPDIQRPSWCSTQFTVPPMEHVVLYLSIYPSIQVPFFLPLSLSLIIYWGGGRKKWENPELSA